MVQPNILLILSDQHAGKYCGFAGHEVVRTPNLDGLAAEGVAFDGAYCNSPLCVPPKRNEFARSPLTPGQRCNDVKMSW